MAVTVLIKRKVSSGNEDLLQNLYIELRGLALRQEGYISGETLRKVGSPGEYLVISKWQHIDDWSKWLVSEDRRQYQERIDSFTNAETKFEIYEQ
ncbi:MAG: antibiotic biosynthesis monooxygenase [Desulfobacteraceae bacterium]|nr:antibiotic biosynthesis monooxygenase [Desulfobacteraceae bacterium]